MKNLNNYILEKLRINKDLKQGDRYKIGDKCLMVSLLTSRKQGEYHLSLDILRIVKITEDTLYYEFLTGFNHAMNLDKPAECKIEKNKGKYWNSHIFDCMCEVFIPHEESLEIIEKIDKNREFQLFRELNYMPEEFDKFVNEDESFKLGRLNQALEVIDYTDEDIKKLKDTL